jgi:hypothetical protein
VGVPSFHDVVGSVTSKPQLSLFSFDLVAALAKAIFVKWIHAGKVYKGGFCVAQGRSSIYAN